MHSVTFLKKKEIYTSYLSSNINIFFFQTDTWLFLNELNNYDDTKKYFTGLLKTNLDLYFSVVIKNHFLANDGKMICFKRG